MFGQEFAQLQIRDRRARTEDDVTHQLFGPRMIGARHHHRLAHSLMVCQRGFDFARFHPKAADFDLLVFAANELNIAIRQPARQIARPIKPSPGQRGWPRIWRRSIQAG